MREKIYAQTHRLKYWGRIIMINNSLWLLKATKCRNKMSQFSDTIHFGFFSVRSSFECLKLRLWMKIDLTFEWIFHEDNVAPDYLFFFFLLSSSGKTWKTKFHAEHSQPHCWHTRTFELFGRLLVKIFCQSNDCHCYHSSDFMRAITCSRKNSERKSPLVGGT